MSKPTPGFPQFIKVLVMLYGVLAFSAVIATSNRHAPPRNKSFRLSWQDVTLKTEYGSLINGKPLTS